MGKKEALSRPKGDAGGVFLGYIKVRDIYNYYTLY